MKYLIVILALLISIPVLAQSKEQNRYRDTAIVYSYFDTTLCALYIMKCDSCRPNIYAAYRIDSAYWSIEHQAVIDKKTGAVKQMIPMPTIWAGDNKKFIKYIRYNKADFPNEWIILKEKQFK